MTVAVTAKRTAMQRDTAAVRRLARELLEQCDHYDRITAEGKDDDLRALVLHNCATSLYVVTGRMARRWNKARAERWRVGGKRGEA